MAVYFIQRVDGGAPDLGRVDDGVSAALASRRGLGRACLAGFGDAVLPQITEAIGRTILTVDALIRTRATRLEQVARATAGALILPDSAGDCPGVAADRAPRGLFLSVVDFLRSPHKPDQITEAWE